MATQRFVRERPSLDDVLKESEQLLIVEALRALREHKAAASQAAHPANNKPHSRRFDERDGGLLAITRLLQRFGH